MKKGFTLVELVVVMMIVTILVTMALQCSKSREHNKKIENDVPLKEKCQIDRYRNDVNRFIFDKHSYIQFGAGSARWGIHDPDCKECKK